MTDEEDNNNDDELGQVSEQVGGIANRFGASETDETIETSDTTEMTDVSESHQPRSAETTETSTMSETTETPKPEDDDFQLRKHWNGRTVYLPDEVIDNLDLRYKECSIKWQQKRGGKLPKNERFYPAVIQAALRETSIEAELGLESDTE